MRKNRRSVYVLTTTGEHDKTYGQLQKLERSISIKKQRNYHMMLLYDLHSNLKHLSAHSRMGNLYHQMTKFNSRCVVVWCGLCSL